MKYQGKNILSGPHSQTIRYPRATAKPLSLELKGER